MHHALSRSALFAASLIAASAIAAACNEGDAATPYFAEDGGLIEGGSSPDSEQPGCGGDPTFAAIRDSVFNKSCAFGSCHGGSNPAAGLDLSSDRACALLVGHPSCVFSNRTRVVPGHPEQSYLYAKVAGTDLGTNPDGTCAGLANGTPSRMPIGGEPLCQGAIDQIKAWITAGAQCDSADGGGGDSGDGGDGGDAQPDSGKVAVASLTSATTTLAVGTDLTVTLTLVGPAPSSGEAVSITSSDPTILTVPTQVFVYKGDTTATFNAHGVKVGSAKVQAQTATLNLAVTP